MYAWKPFHIIPAIVLSFTILSCSNPTRNNSSPSSTSSSSTSVETNSLGSQTGTLVAGTAGTATFTATLANVPDATPGSIAWYTSSAGSTVGSAPTGVSTTITVVQNNNATVTVSITSTASAGLYYFTLSEGSVISKVATLVINAPVSITYPTSDGTSKITTSTFTIAGAYTASTAPSIIVCFGGKNNTTATINSTTQTWTASIDASSLANGTKQIWAVATWTTNGTTITQNASGSADYEGSSNITGYSISGTVSFPSNASIPSGDYVDIYIESADGTNTTPCNAASQDIPLTTATSYSYTVSGLAQGNYWIACEVHDASWSSNRPFSGGIYTDFSVPTSTAENFTLSKNSN